MRHIVEQIIYDKIILLNGEWKLKRLAIPDSNTAIYPSPDIDSLMLIRLIVEIEDGVAEVFKDDILLADAAAMSQTKSPFRTVDNLTNYICAQINKG